MMNTPPLHRAGHISRAFLTAVAVLLVASHAAAAEGPLAEAQVTVADIRLEGMTEERGQLELLSIFLPGDSADVMAPSLDVRGAQVNATVYEQSYDQVAIASTENVGCMPLLGIDVGCATRTTTLAQDAELRVTGVQPFHQVGVFGAVAHVASYADGGVFPMDHPQLGPEGISTIIPGGGTSGEPSFWTLPHTPGARVNTVVRNGAVHLVLEGDFTLEVMGVDFLMRDAAGRTTMLHSGTDRDGWVPGIESARAVTSSFLRITVTGGHADILVRDDATAVEWTGLRAATVTDGAVSMSQASGLAEFGGEERRIEGESLRSTGVTTLAITAGDGDLPVELTRADPAVAARATAPALPGGLAAWIAGGGAFAAAGAVAVALAVRRRHVPALADVEAAIEAGHYRRAAADAARILRHRPTSEDALLSRAIALCKAGRPKRVVAELLRHLHARKPSDGSLHYVLGLAYLDMGQRAHAAEVFGEAVRRTPSLLTDVQGKLGGPGTTSRTQQPLPGPESTHGYA